MYFDSHAHYDDERFDEDRASLLHWLHEQGKVEGIINIAADIKASYKCIEMAKEFDFVHAAVGVHPHEVANLQEEDLLTIENLAKEPKVVAIGEIGLDYYYDFSPRDVQREWFKKQLELSKKLDLPIVVHSREACQETFDLLMESKVNHGVIHCFSGSKELAKEYVKKGFYIGVGGAVTFKNARKIVEVVEEIGIEHLLIETDAPYLAPVPNRGKRNDSSQLKYIVEKISEIKQIMPEEVCQIVSKNAKQLFHL
jgi:TatD DNase family protein